MTRNVVPLVEAMSIAVIDKLMTPKNAAKKHWLTKELDYLQNRLQEEVDELSEAIANGATPEAVLSECCDVIAFASFIAHKYGSLVVDA